MLGILPLYHHGSQHRTQVARWCEAQRTAVRGLSLATPATHRDNRDPRGATQSVRANLPAGTPGRGCGRNAIEAPGPSGCQATGSNFLIRHFLRRLRHLPLFVSGRPVFEGPLYREAELARLANLFGHVDLEQWKGLRILEVGAGLGHLGDAFRQLGFDVTSSDGRAEHVERMRAAGKNALVLDLDSVDPNIIADFDIVLAFGVLYHLSEPEHFLTMCGENAEILLLETAVLDRSEAAIEMVAEAGGRRGQDQALNVYGCRPSPAWVEQTCRDAGFDSVRDISTPMANWSIGVFDWDPRDDGTYRREGLNFRKMWVCEKS